MGTVWTQNSFVCDPTTFTDTLCNLVYATIIVSGCGLFHSYSLHRWRFNSVRIKSDLACLSTMLAGLLFIPVRFGGDTPSARSVIFYDFFYIGFFPLCIQLCDNYMFYYRLLAVTKVSPWRRTLFHLYITFVLSATWFPIYSIIPFFLDTNGDAVAYYYFITLSIQVWGTLAYNAYFTIEFSLILRSIRRGKANQTSALRRTANFRTMISIKSIIHCITSSTASMLYLFIPVIGNPIYLLMIILGMHLLFNAHIETYLIQIFSLSPDGLASSQGLFMPSDLADAKELKDSRDPRVLPLSLLQKSAPTVAAVNTGVIVPISIRVDKECKDEQPQLLPMALVKIHPNQ